MSVRFYENNNTKYYLSIVASQRAYEVGIRDVRPLGRSLELARFVPLLVPRGFRIVSIKKITGDIRKIKNPQRNDLW